MFEFTEEQIQRYSRQIILPEVGGKGQKKIAGAKVFLIGAGGLGSPAALYLAAAGVGRIGIIDADHVDLSNLQRQVLHSTATLNRSKVESARETLSRINPDIRIDTYNEKLTSENIMGLINDYDIILDGSDNFPTRFLVNDACYFQKKTLISGSIFRFEGQLTTLKGHLDQPCYRCLYPEPPPPGLVPSCQEAGVLGVLAGTIGVLQAAEALKEIIGIGSSLAGRLLLYDALQMRFREVKVRKDKNCPLCSEHPTITKLLEYQEYCSI
ncbi:MAG: molybdopterin-synthase adenylyltransferase MoeB [Nitrospirae bacterium]|nr:molybdopterin-synthase adenylyltransferase MoeB [Nitrospirota bacterium]